MERTRHGRRSRVMGLMASVLGGLSGLDVDGHGSEVKPDEQIVFFPATARLSDGGDCWIVRIHGWIFEPESDSGLRAAALGQVRRILNGDLDPRVEATFRDRAHWFLVDSERGKHLEVRVGELTYPLPASRRDGHFAGTIRVPAETVSQLADGDWLRFQAVTRAGDRRVFQGEACLIQPDGLSVISDIDDTIKVTEVSDLKKLIANVFVRPYRAVNGMAEIYQAWAGAGAKFHLVSSSPWQLYHPLSQFVREAGFPEATYHLRPFRMKGTGFCRLLDDPMARKPKVIESLLEDYARRHFILVGDSGQLDPEIYAQIAQNYPRQIRHIYIRDVTGEPADAPRYRETFADLPERTWTVFRDAENLTFD